MEILWTVKPAFWLKAEKEKKEKRMGKKVLMRSIFVKIGRLKVGAQLGESIIQGCGTIVDAIIKTLRVVIVLSHLVLQNFHNYSETDISRGACIFFFTCNGDHPGRIIIAAPFGYAFFGDHFGHVAAHIVHAERRRIK